MVPVRDFSVQTGLFDTITGLVLFHAAFQTGFCTLFMRNFMKALPYELIESARVDGAGHVQIFSRIMLPLMAPAIAAFGIFQFLWTWNDLLVALTFGRQTQPITVAIFSQLRQFGANIELIAPATFVSLAIPLLVFFALGAPLGHASARC